MGIDFTQLASPISQAFDTDFMDVYRQVEGSPERDLIIINAPCHIAIKTTDNADPTSVDVQPIITSLRLHFDNSIKVKNNDYIIAKKCDTKGNVLHYYSGIVGEPAVSMARQSVNMQMSTLKEQDEPPTPPPAPVDESIDITINYLDSDEQPIKPSAIQKAKLNSKAVIKPIEIEDYYLDRVTLNSELVPTGDVIIENVEDENYEINFYYQTESEIMSIRPLVNGYYTMDNGNVKKGYHLYAEIPVLSVTSENSIKLASNKFYHEEIGTLEFSTEETEYTVNKFRDNLDNWHIITAIPARVEDGYIITFADTEPVEAYECHWYG